MYCMYCTCCTYCICCMFVFCLSGSVVCRGTLSICIPSGRNPKQNRIRGGIIRYMPFVQGTMHPRKRQMCVSINKHKRGVAGHVAGHFIRNTLWYQISKHKRNKLAINGASTSPLHYRNTCVDTLLPWKCVVFASSFLGVLDIMYRL